MTERPPALYMRRVLIRFALALNHGVNRVPVMDWELRRLGLSAEELATEIGGGWTIQRQRDHVIFSRSASNRSAA